MKMSRLLWSDKDSASADPLSRVAGALRADVFPAGSMVFLRNGPGPWGTVLGMHQGRVVVRWSGLNQVAKHPAASLILASTPDEYDSARENEDEQED